MADPNRAGYIGPVPPLVWALLHGVWNFGLGVQANTARMDADLVALAASAGWISTVDPSGKTYSRVWRITAHGIQALQRNVKDHAE